MREPTELERVCAPLIEAAVKQATTADLGGWQFVAFFAVVGVCLVAAYWVSKQ